MTPTRPLLVTASALLVSLASCASFEFEGQDVQLRHLPDQDALELRLAYFGLRPDGDQVTTARDALTRIAAGGRHFILYGWPWEIDADAAPGGEDEPVEAQRLHAWLLGFEIVDAGLFRDRRGRLGAWQHLRFPDLEHGVDLANAAIGRMCLEELHSDAPPLGDPELVERYRAAAADGHRWIALERGCLRISFPSSPRGTAELLREIAAEEGDWGPVLQPLTSFDVVDGCASFVYEPAADGLLTFRFDFPEAEPSEELAAALADEAELAGEPPDWVGALDRTR